MTNGEGRGWSGEGWARGRYRQDVGDSKGKRGGEDARMVAIE